MDPSKLEDRYARILERFADEVITPPGAAERRVAPRIPVASRDVRAVVAELGVRSDVDVQTQDISTSGVCFYADRPFAIGSEVELSVTRVFSLAAVVVSCDMEETDTDFMEMRYRVRCHFSNEHHGMELLVLAKEGEVRGGGSGS